MSSPLTVKRNDYHARPKRSDVYTPEGVAWFLFDTLRFAERRSLDRPAQFLTVLDPAIGSGRLTNPWYQAGRTIIGCDVADVNPACHRLIRGRFEDQEGIVPRPDIAICNPLCCGQHNGFSVAQIIMWSSSFLQPYFSMMLVFCTT